MTAAGTDLVTAIRRNAEQRPDHTALTWLDGLTEPAGALTAAQVDHEAARVAAALRASVEPGARVLLLFPPGLDFVPAFVGCLYAGCLPVPVYPVLDGEGLAVIGRIRDDCAASAVLVADAATAAAAEPLVGLPAVLPGTDLLVPESAPDPAGAAFLQYTSGSTSAPKGVVVTHGNLTANLDTIRDLFGHGPESTILSWLPVYHDMGLIGNVLHSLRTGSSLLLASPLDLIRDPLAWPRAISRHGVDTSGGPNFAYDLVVRAIRRHGPPEADLSGWTRAYCGAEQVNPGSMARFAEALAPLGFDAGALMPCYGLAEATLLVSSASPGSGVADVDGVTSCGAPRDCEVAVLDGSGEPVPDGGVGELAVAGASVSPGYWGRAPRADRWLRTGDLGFLADGELHVTGRSAEVLVVRGRNHHPHDVERLVAETVPAFRPGCVVAFAQDGRVVVVGELREGAALTPADVERAASAIASAHGLPVAEVVGVPRGDVPKTTSGKLQRGRCARRYRDGGYDAHRTALGGARAAGAVAASRDAASTDATRADAAGAGAAGAVAAADPSTTGPHAPAAPAPTTTTGAVTADAVSALVADVLGWERVDAEVALTAQGLDSVGAVLLAHALEREHGAVLPVRALLDGARPRDLAEHLTGGAPARPAPRTTGGKLSQAQEALVFLQAMNPGSDEYTISHAVELPADVDLGALRTALRVVVLRHPELGVRIADGPDGPRREPVDPDALRDAVAPAPVPVREEWLRDQLADAAAVPFDLAEGPLVRLHLWRTPERVVLQLVAHHVVLDLWSLCLVLRDVATAHDALRRGEVPRLPPVTPYDAYVAAQEDYLASPAASARAAALRERLPSRAEALGVRVDHPRGPRRSARGATAHVLLDGDAARFLDATDPVPALVALWGLCLGRYGTPGPVVVGVPAAGRPGAALGQVVGLCTNTVPVAVDTDPARPLADLLADVRDQLLDGVEHGLFPLSAAVEAVRPPREPGRTPLVETLLVLTENPLPSADGLADVLAGVDGATVRLGGLELRNVVVPRRTCRYDLDVVVTARDGGYAVRLDYAADLFTEDTAASVLDTFAAAVRAAAGAATTGDTAVLSERDLAWLDRVGRSTTPALPHDPAELVRRVALEHPDLPAVQAPDATLTFAELHRRTERLARALAEAAPADPGAPPQVGLLLDPSADFATALLAAWRAGLGVVPLPPEFPDARLSAMLAGSGARLLLAGPGLRERADALAGGVFPDGAVTGGAVAGGAVTVLPADAEPADPTAPLPAPDRAAPAFTVFTSGSTGAPKGVLVRHDHLSPHLAWFGDRFAAGPGTRTAQTLSLGFDFGLQELFTTIPFGGCLVVPDPADRRDARRYARFLRRAAVTTLFTTPSFADELAATAEPLPDLAVVLLGGEVLTGATVTALRGLLGPDCRLFNGYGPTEATVNCLVHEVGPGGQPAVLPVGEATSGSSVRVVGADRAPLPVGAVGELLIGGNGVTGGYLAGPAGGFVADPEFGGPDGLAYLSGDLGHVRPGGGFVVHGRADRQVKVRGFRVEPAEVEHLLRAHPDVDAAVVLAVGSPVRLVAFAVGPARREDLAPWLAERLPRNLVPESVLLLDRVPLTPNGKVDEAALRELADAEGALPPEARRSPGTVERAVCRVWEQALGGVAVTADANVFDLGAHSLIVTRVHQRLEAVLGLSFPVHSLFDHPRPSALAEYLITAATDTEADR
ncbi:AMP-binding protein [Actinosynnema mirum]|uniref:Amino acid adenylation domain protein n=1 Tax=Actinosynnema mirum (strain ATCC 29888 / DSM 43827 / JCM 3225 / NBRC 14064 / NCIMB 13271 / NRRL B-12336 / IMRU 3971 / 101) TaxID=446462 RepID=C6WQP8_ACTMD|nr:AMP-binding protein [Actinosynnema mirum]ACU38738.1 amino acid adenylation domain protein [Actinosynnema mirum DSM 43827]